MLVVEAWPSYWPDNIAAKRPPQDARRLPYRFPSASPGRRPALHRPAAAGVSESIITIAAGGGGAHALARFFEDVVWFYLCRRARREDLPKVAAALAGRQRWGRHQGD